MEKWQKEQQIVVENIKRLRKDFNYSQKHVAECLNISLYRFRKIEKNEVEIKFVEISKLCKEFFVDLSDLFKENPKPSIVIICNNIKEYGY